MILPGNQWHATNGLVATVAANPTPASFRDGFGVDANGNLCCATGAVTAQDTWANGFRFSPLGALRVSTAAAPDSSNGYLFTANGQVHISTGASAVVQYSNGNPFTVSGRLCLSY